MVPVKSELPLSFDVYQMIIPLFQKALGIYYYSDYYVARQETYRNMFVFFDRFVYDLISMFGLNLFYIDVATLEMLLRILYRSVTFYRQGRVRLRRLEDICPAFTEQEFEDAIRQKNRMDGTMITFKVGSKNIDIGQQTDMLKKASEETKLEPGIHLGRAASEDDETDQESLFGGLLGDTANNLLEIREKKKQQKRQTIEKMKRDA